MATFAERARAGVAPLSPGERDDWIAFQARNHGQRARQADPAWLAWQEANPQLGGSPLAAWICRRNGAIVGSQGSVPFRLKEGDQILPAAWAVDLMVEPEWRLRGVGPALTEAQTQAGELVAALGISPAAYRAYLRAGWRDLGDIPNYVRPRDVNWSVSQAGLRGARAVAARAVGRPALFLTRVSSNLVSRVLRTSLERIDRFDERVDAAWAVASTKYPVLSARDLTSLRWRYDDVPDAARNARHYLVQGGRVRGYVVTRRERRRDGEVLAIVDFLAPPRWMVPLLGRVIALEEAGDVVAITCRTLSRGSEAAFRAAGFIRVAADDRPGPLNRAASTPLRLMVYQGEQPDRLAFERDLWFVTTGDSDFGWAMASTG
jgi:GNAT superfamily N-acetyltransferase